MISICVCGHPKEAHEAIVRKIGADDIPSRGGCKECSCQMFTPRMSI